jgi:hypothetical protein
LGEIVIPAWEAIDPTVPRPGRLPDDFASLKDADAKGKAFRVAVDKFYGSLPETGNSWLREVLAPPYAAGYAIDVSKIARHYIPEGTSFDEAERVLLAAGMTIVATTATAAQSEKWLRHSIGNSVHRSHRCRFPLMWARRLPSSICQ